MNKRLSEPLVVTLQPEKIEHEQLVVDHLLAGRVVIVDFRKTDAETARRIISFLEGALYGVSGEMLRLREDLILLVPGGMLYKGP